MTSSIAASLFERLAPWRARFDTLLATSVKDVVDRGVAAPKPLVDAMEYALLAPGKRLRPLLVFAAGAACLRLRGGSKSAAFDDALFSLCTPAAIAVEHVHAYSLVHDDLPGMDNDDLRRGRPTVHIAFSESTAILAGDGLLTNAFLHLARAQHHAAAQIQELALAAGSVGMVGGQHDDMQLTQRTLADLEHIHARKTGCLFRASTRLGALAVDAPEHASALATFGEKLGLAFQISDDLLDVTADPTRAGKRLHRDDEKITFVKLVGIDEAKKRAADASASAIAAIASFSDPLLEDLARFAAHRDH